MEHVAGSARQKFNRTSDHLRDSLDADCGALPDVERATVGDLGVHSEKICPHDVAHVGEITRLGAVPVDGERFSFAAQAEKNTDYGDVRAGRRHPRTENIEVAQS